MRIKAKDLWWAKTASSTSRSHCITDKFYSVMHAKLRFLSGANSREVEHGMFKCEDTMFTFVLHQIDFNLSKDKVMKDVLLKLFLESDVQSKSFIKNLTKCRFSMSFKALLYSLQVLVSKWEKRQLWLLHLNNLQVQQGIIKWMDWLLLFYYIQVSDRCNKSYPIQCCHKPKFWREPTALQLWTAMVKAPHPWRWHGDVCHSCSPCWKVNHRQLVNGLFWFL